MLLTGVRLCGSCRHLLTSRTSPVLLHRVLRSFNKNLFNHQLVSGQQRSFTRLRLFALFQKSPGLIGVGVISCGLAPLAFRLVHCKSKTKTRVDSIRDQQSQREHLTLAWQDVWLLIRPHLAWLIGAVVAALLTALININVPLLLGELVNNMAEIVKAATPDRDQLSTPILSVVVKLVGYYVAQAVLTCAYISCLTVLGERMATQLRVDLFQSLISQDMAFFDAQRVGELVARLNTDVQEFKSSFKLCISQGLRTVTQIGGSVVCLYMISPSMTIYTVSVLPVVIVVGTAFGALLRVLSRKAQQQSALAATVAEEALSNIRTVRSFAMEGAEIEMFKHEVVKLQWLNEILGLGIGIFQGAANLLLNGVVISVLYFGSNQIIDTKLTPGDLMSFLVTAQTIQRSMQQLSVLFGQAVRGYTAGARVFEFIHCVPVLPLSGGRRIPHHSLVGDLKFENVAFAYPTRPTHQVFNNFNLHISPGQTVALVGPSGAGKSTIAALLSRFYDVSFGAIKVDGVDVRFLDPQWWRGHVVGMISQEPVLFATTIRENIRYGKPTATNDEIEDAARQANAHAFISGFPDGYETLVGERGVTLSGGQKQRVAIARALLKDPPILVLDEATSALDTESEKLVHDALERACRNRTVLIIAHRLSTIQNADLIAVIGDGKVLETGSHAQLIKRKGGVYQRLIAAQTNSSMEHLFT